MSLSVLTPQMTAQVVPRTATEKTSQGDLKITSIAHGSVMFEFGGKVIYVDPWSQADLSAYPKADWIFITDIHGDHHDPRAHEILKKEGTKLVAPAAVAEKAPEALVLKNGETKSFDGIEVEGVAMYNTRPGADGSYAHEKGRGNGYVFHFGDKRVYVAGDTACTPEMRQLKNIDIAFLPMYGARTMSPEEAAVCAKEFRPKLVYAYHYRDDDPKIAEQMLAGSGIEMRIGARSPAR
jgi:L-ascorbate metabolism protein UlaG (beta-lactamase superfamily)